MASRRPQEEARAVSSPAKDPQSHREHDTAARPGLAAGLKRTDQRTRTRHVDTPVNPEAVAEEQQRLDKLRRMVDVTCAVLRQAVLTRREAEDLVVAARRDSLELFPDKGEVFELVIAPRFQRILDERWPARSPRVLPFRPRSRVP
jgi:hypothetical protein